MSGGLCPVFCCESIVGELLVCVFLPLLPRNMKMVDIVTQKMPSENDVHVARSFLTKILRSSMRYGSACGFIVIISTCSLCSTPCALNHVDHSSSHIFIFIPLVATLPWFITCPHWIVLWPMSLDEWYASHLYRMQYTVCPWLVRNELECHLICSVHVFPTCNSERIALKGMFHMHNWQLYQVFH